MSFFAADEISLAVFSLVSFLFKEPDFLSFPLLVYEDFVSLLGGRLVAAAAVFFSTFYFKVILLPGFGVLLSIFEDILKKDLLAA